MLKLVGFSHAYLSDLFWSVYMLNLVVWWDSPDGSPPYLLLV
jgi:hypothetical protein